MIETIFFRSGNAPLMLGPKVVENIFDYIPTDGKWVTLCFQGTFVSLLHQPQAASKCRALLTLWDRQGTGTQKSWDTRCVVQLLSSYAVTWSWGFPLDHMGFYCGGGLCHEGGSLFVPLLLMWLDLHFPRVQEPLI